MATRPAPIPTSLQQAQQIVGAQYKPIDFALAQQARQSAAQQGALQAAQAALVNTLQQGVAPATQMYDQALGQQQALAQAGAQGLAAANPNAQIQQSLGQINAPVEQQQQLAHALQAQYPGQAAVLNVLQGTVPGASLVAQKANVQNYLSGLPAVAGMAGTQALRELLSQAAEQRNALIGQRLQAAAQVPSLAMSIQQARAAAALKQAEFNATQAYRQAGLGIRGAELQSLNQYRKAEIGQRADTQAALDAYRQQGLISTSQYRQALLALRRQGLQQRQQSAKTSGAKVFGGGSSGYYRLNPDGTITQLVKGTGGGSSKTGISPTTRYAAFQRTKKNVQTLLGIPTGKVSTNPYGGTIAVPGKAGKAGAAPVGVSTSTATSTDQLGVSHAHRQEAFQKLYTRFAGDLLRAGVKPNSIKAMIDTALNEAGYAIGKRGGKPVDSRGQVITGP